MFARRRSPGASRILRILQIPRSDGEGIASIIKKSKRKRQRRWHAWYLRRSMGEKQAEMDVKIEASWKEALKDEFGQDYFKEMREFVKGEYQHAIVYPPPKNIFRAFDLCPFDKVEVVILGQDPYHGPKQANGLCFA